MTILMTILVSIVYHKLILENLKVTWHFYVTEVWQVLVGLSSGILGKINLEKKIKLF